MTSGSVIFTFFLIFTGAALMATLALYARQALPVSYILLGLLLGPSGVGLVEESSPIQDIAHIGIMFLLFLLGLDLKPQELLRLARQTTVNTLLSSLLFALLGGAVGWLFSFNTLDSLLIGVAMMFSSTIIGLKLLPTTVLHHQRTGEVIISVLLLQDLIAILVLLLIQGSRHGELPLWEVGRLFVVLPALFVFAYLFERYVLIVLLRRFDKIKEYLFLMTVGWCLGIAELAAALGLSHTIGAFIAGVVLATNPIALYIGENLKPLRDFFLIIFFFSLGAGLDLELVLEILLPASVLAALTILFKPLAFSFLLHRAGEKKSRAAEIGVRLGQGSEFSLLIAVLALNLGVIGSKAAYLIQVSTLLTFIISSYLIVFRYPTPVAVSDRLRRD